MGQCVIKDCGFNVQKLNGPERKDRIEFLKERIKDRYSSLDSKPKSQKSQNSNDINEKQIENNKYHEDNDSSMEENLNESQNQETHENAVNIKKEPDNLISSTKNLQKFKDHLSLNESLLKNKHFFTPKTSEDDNGKEVKAISKNSNIKFKKNDELQNSKKMESSPKSTALQTDNNDKKFQNGFQNNFFNPTNFENSPDNQTPTPTKVEFGNIFTEEELSDGSRELENFEKKFPQELIEKIDRKSKIPLN